MRRSGLPIVVATVLLFAVGVALGIPQPCRARPLRLRRCGRYDDPEARCLRESARLRECSRVGDGLRGSGASGRCAGIAASCCYLDHNRTSAACVPGDEPDLFGTAEARPDVSRSPPVHVIAGRRDSKDAAERRKEGWSVC